MIELPSDFIHQPPKGYRYESIQFKTNVDAIWTISDRRFLYNDGDESRCIWGFVKHKRTKRSSTHTYHAPVNCNKVGVEVNINETSPYTAMQLNLTPLEQFFV
jgi:hypothetical protein